MLISPKNLFLGVVLVTPVTSRVLAQTACVEPTGSDFRTVTLVAPGGVLSQTPNNFSGPVQMAVTPDGRVFIVQMQSGDVQLYDPSTGSVTLAGNIPVRFMTEDGLLGVAVPFDFATTHWIYFYYTMASSTVWTEQLTRYTVTNNQITNPKVILQFNRDPNVHYHSAGGIEFDGNGNLILGVGDNCNPSDAYSAGYGPLNPTDSTGNAQKSAANSNDLRGKILRIHPIAFADSQTPALGIGTTYSIPAGNLWEKINDPKFNPNWNSQVDSINLVRHEIYTMGSRNPYHPRIDTRTGWVFWGEPGPNSTVDDSLRGPSGHDEWNLAKQPGFYGHPYCNGYNVPYGAPPFTGVFYNCNAPVNNSPVNTGIHDLPPSVPPLVAYSNGNSTDDDPRFNADGVGTTTENAPATAIGGQMYRYDPNLVSTVKFPPYYEGKVIFFDWEREMFRWIVLDSTGAIPAGAAGVRAFTPTGLPTASYIDAEFGPEGALYLLRISDKNYSVGSGGGLYRVEYTGSYDDACYKPFGPQASTSLAVKPELLRSLSPMRANGFYTLPAGYRALTLFNLAGRWVWSYHRTQTDFPYQVRLPAFLAQGIWEARVEP